jgi:hypothetical protein
MAVASSVAGVIVDMEGVPRSEADEIGAVVGLAVAPPGWDTVRGVAAVGVDESGVTVDALEPQPTSRIIRIRPRLQMLKESPIIFITPKS